MIAGPSRAPDLPPSRHPAIPAIPLPCHPPSPSACFTNLPRWRAGGGVTSAVRRRSSDRAGPPDRVGHAVASSLVGRVVHHFHGVGDVFCDVVGHDRGEPRAAGWVFGSVGAFVCDRGAGGLADGVRGGAAGSAIGGLVDRMKAPMVVADNLGSVYGEKTGRFAAETGCWNATVCLVRVLLADWPIMALR